jgi:hypothetical protein
MSNSQAHEPVTVESDGVTVTKRFEDDEFPVPTIVFEFVSGRDEPVRVRLSDRVPEEVAVGDLGFHPEHGSEHWEVDEERITFERELEAGTEYATVYGVRVTDTDNIEDFLTEPTFERVDPPLPGDTTTVPRAEEVASDQGAVPESPESRHDGDGHAKDVAELNLTDPTATDTVNKTAAGSEVPEAGDADETTAAETGEGLVAAIADEIRSGSAAAADLELVAQALDQRETDRTAESTGARPAAPVGVCRSPGVHDCTRGVPRRGGDRRAAHRAVPSRTVLVQRPPRRSRIDS